MDPSQLLRVTTLAVAFRAAILGANRNKLLPSLRDFPSGACGDASLLLARFLEESGLGTALYVWGHREKYSHGWLESGNLIVDITSDQFLADPEAILVLDEPPQTTGGVLVTTDRSWHSQFEDMQRHAARIDIYDDFTNKVLQEAYREIRSRL